MGPVVDSNEAMRCEYIATILHTAVSFIKGLVISPQMNSFGDESSCRDYAIKKILDHSLEEKIMYVTQAKQNQPGNYIIFTLQCN
jgi:hypothetical protein